MSTLTHSPRITPFLWFDNNAEDAVNFYVSIFPRSRIFDTVPNQSGNSRSTVFPGWSTQFNLSRNPE